MRRALSVALIATLGLFGCAVPEEAADSERWSKVLTDAVAPIQHVEKTVDLGYSLQGPFGADSAWLNGTLWTDTDDPEINRAVLDEAGRAIAESFAQNPAKKSWVKVAVASKSGTPYELHDLLDKSTVTLDDLAAHYGIPRR